jgi:tetratricopeptide (TPR) repeat protein
MCQRVAGFAVGVLLVVVAAGSDATGVRAQTAASDSLSGRPLLTETRASARLVRTARRQLFAFRMGPAKATLNRLAARPDGAAAATHHRALMALLKGLVTDDEAHFDAFFERADALGERLDDAPDGPWKRYLRAETALLRVIARAKTGSHTRAAWAARSAFGRYEDLAENPRSPARADALMGRGLLHTVVGALPEPWRGLLSFLGFDGSVTQGRAELAQAATQSRLHQLPAGLMLALVDLALFRNAEKARQRLARWHRKRPKSLLVAHLYGLALLNTHRATEAARVLRAALERAATPAYFYLEYLDYYCARALFRTDDFEGAARHYRRYLSRHDGAALRAKAHLRLGEALEMQGRRREALRHYRKVGTARDFDSDRAARRGAAKRLDAPMTPRQRTLLLGQNAYDAGRYARADSLLTRVFEAPDATAVEQGEAAYRRGRVYQAQKRWSKARRAYRFAMRHPGDPKAKWAPWSQFYLGEIHEAQGRPAKARTAYRKALDYEDFDYAQSLEQSARSALARLEQ